MATEHILWTALPCPGILPFGFEKFWNKARFVTRSHLMPSLWGPGQASRLLLATQRAGLVSKSSGLFPSPQWGWYGGAGLGARTQALPPSPLGCLPSVLHDAREEPSPRCLIWDLMGNCSVLETHFIRPRGDFPPIPSSEATRKSNMV